MKRFLSVALSLLMGIMVFGTSYAQAASVSAAKTPYVVPPIDYQSVAVNITAAEEVTVVQYGTEEICYYWNDTSFVVKDSNGYYLVEINDTFTQFSVNGRTFDIVKQEATARTKAITYPTAWSTMIDDEFTFDVGGLPHSVVGGLIGSALGGLIPSGGISIAVGAVVGALTGMFLSGVFPMDYKLAVDIFQRFRTIEPASPMVLEYYEELGIYGGPSANIYADQFYYDERTYMREIWE